jgi:Ca2+-binding EF-hand superfamily protein
MIDEDNFDNLNDEKTFQQLIHAKAIELFQICDNELKGFIIKTDMQRIQEFIGLTRDELEDVFDSFDLNNNGYITFEQFINGFYSYHGAAVKSEKAEDSMSKETNEDALFEETLASLGAQCHNGKSVRFC